MSQVEAEVIYVSPERLQELSDKQSFLDYQRERARESDSARIQHLGLYRIKRLARSEVESLPDQHREVVRMHFWGCLSFSEIAMKLNSSCQKVEKIYNQALDLLKYRIIRALNKNCNLLVGDSLCGKL